MNRQPAVFTTLLGCLVVLQTMSAPVLAQNSLATDTPWPKFHADLRNTAQSTLLGPLTADIKWAYMAPEKILASPAIASDGTIYFGAGFKFYALNPDGSLKWKRPQHADVSQSSPAVAKDGTIYVGDRANVLSAINPDGTTKWEFRQSAEGDIRSSPSIAPDGTIYFGFTGLSSRFGVVTALNPDGTLKYPQFSVGVVIYSAPAIASSGRVYIASRDGALYAFSPDLTRIWKLKVGKTITFSSPAIGADGTIYIGANTGLSAVNQDGSLQWTYATNGTAAVSSPAIASDGTIYIGSVKSSQKTLYAVKPDGTLKWQFAPRRSGFGASAFTAIGADGIIYSGMGNTVYALDPDGTVLWQYATGGSISASPAIGGNATPADGGEAILYIGSRDHRVYAFASQRAAAAVRRITRPSPRQAPINPDRWARPSRSTAPRASIPAAPAIASYQWDFGDSTTSSGTVVSHSYASPGQ